MGNPREATLPLTRRLYPASRPQVKQESDTWVGFHGGQLLRTHLFWGGASWLPDGGKKDTMPVACEGKRRWIKTVEACAGVSEKVCVAVGCYYIKAAVVEGGQSGPGRDDGALRVNCHAQTCPPGSGCQRVGCVANEYWMIRDTKLGVIVSLSPISACLVQIRSP